MLTVVGSNGFWNFDSNGAADVRTKCSPWFSTVLRLHWKIVRLLWETKEKKRNLRNIFNRWEKHRKNNILVMRVHNLLVHLSAQALKSFAVGIMLCTLVSVTLGLLLHSGRRHQRILTIGFSLGTLVWTVYKSSTAREWKAFRTGPSNG